MKKSSLIISFILLLLITNSITLVVAKFSTDVDTDHDLYREKRSLAKFSVQEMKDLISLYESASSENQDDDILYDLLNEEIIPNYFIHLQNLRGLNSPESVEVRSLHRLFMDTIETPYHAFTKIKKAIEDKDLELKSQAIEELEEVEELINEYNKKSDYLYNRYGPG
ncbi:hypothetical protein [Chengkuizengella sediminis]|uniref:hypothetical protein n=1 Tax=Chengkuizengella sediminis TaxID=1885917 RepID=UPI00138A2FCD|nr:hypothetical protein [Chengkuizengella sediminis]NDI35750.1 hypothetical protein [Chengkuizengella sediminis]